jgi:DNA phosphorothioation-dependent restriction protein DptG
LTPELKKEQPELEALLKEFYLNKWYYSHLTSLSGMSPSEASQTEEGTRLLWTMFKQIKQKENAVGNRNQQFRIHLKEYVRTVEQKKRRK